MTEGTRYIPKFNVFCVLFKRKVFAEHTVTEIMQLGMDEFPMLILKRKVLTCYSARKHLWIFTWWFRWDVLDWKSPWKWISRGRVTGPLHFPDFTPLVSSSGVYKGCCLYSIIAHHFAGTGWEDTSCHSYSYTPCAYNLLTNTDLVHASLLTALSCNTHNLII